MNERDLQATLARMAETGSPPEDARDAEERRERVVPSIEAALRGVASDRVRARRRARWLGGLALAASIALAVGVGWRVRGGRAPVAVVSPPVFPAHVAQSSGTVLVMHAGATTVIPASNRDAPLESSDAVITTPDGRARVALASGAVVEVAPSTQLSFAIPADAVHDERLTLSAGQTSAHVPQLGPGESFEIVTPDAEVIVRGTGFVVSVRNEGTPRTHVSVSEGAVLVRHAGQEFRVAAGEEWPAPETAAQTAPQTPAPAPSAAAAPSSAPAGSLRAPSTLGDQNALLQSALDARRSGDDARAVTLLEQFLTRYPTSPLAQEAHVERFRALERMGRHSAAVSAARLYLVAFPNGFARDEAKAIVLR
jgi:hypothetical protein